MSRWQNSSLAVTLAALGAMLGLASALGEWSRVILHNGGTAPAWTLLSLGPLGLPYVLSLLVMLKIALFSRQGISRLRRVAGLVLGGLSLALLVALAGMFTGDSGFGTLYYRVNSSIDQQQILGWGLYAAFGALIALGTALILASPPRRPTQAVTDTPATG